MPRGTELAPAAHVRHYDKAVGSEPLAPFDPWKPNIARAYDFLLGGKDNFAADRELAARIMEVYPLAAAVARDSREFLARAVDYVARQGIAQFIDIGSGLPTAPNTHEVATKANPASRVIYVDNDPVVIAHARALLTAAGHADVMPGDLRDPEAIIASVRQGGLISLDEPACVILGTILHFFDPAEAVDIVAALVRAIVPGSFLILSIGFHNETPELADRFVATYDAAAIHAYDRKQAASCFAGLELVEPGLVEARCWRPVVPPASEPSRPGDVLAGVARKPA